MGWDVGLPCRHYAMCVQGCHLPTSISKLAYVVHKRMTRAGEWPGRNWADWGVAFCSSLFVAKLDAGNIIVTSHHWAPHSLVAGVHGKKSCKSGKSFQDTGSGSAYDSAPNA